GGWRGRSWRGSATWLPRTRTSGGARGVRPGRVAFIAPSWWFDQAGDGCRGRPGDRIAPPKALRRRRARRGGRCDGDELSALPIRPAVAGRLGDRAREPLAGGSG